MTSERYVCTQGIPLEQTILRSYAPIPGGRLLSRFEGSFGCLRSLCILLGLRIHLAEDLGNLVDAFRDLLSLLCEVELRGVPLTISLSGADESALDELIHPDELGPLVALVEAHQLRLRESGIVADRQQDVQR